VRRRPPEPRYPQTLDVKLDGLAHLSFAFLQGVAGRDHARQIRRVSAVIGRAVALDHNRILTHDSPLSCLLSLASVFIQPGRPLTSEDFTFRGDLRRRGRGGGLPTG
jgi:hypothetical protein